MKAYRFITMLAVLGLFQVGSAALVAEWNFDDSNDLGKDSTGINDLSTSSGHTTPTYDANGIVGGAASFVNDSAFVTPAGIYPDGDFTFSAWLKPSDTSVNTMFTPLSGRGGFQLYGSGSQWRITVQDSAATDYYKVGPAIVADEWVHIAIYYNAIGSADASGNYTGTLRMWVDGVNLGGVNDAKYNPNDTYTMNIGAVSTYGDYRGLIDEVKLYDTALDGAAIEALAAVPEPATISLLGIAACGLLLLRRSLRK